MRIELEVSNDNEHTESPWWLIIDPRQNFKTGPDGAWNIINMITGPFFSREEAETHLKCRRHDFSKHACVFCHSGYYSHQYKTALRQARARERVTDVNGDMEEAAL